MVLSSISSSERSFPGRGFPWAVILAACLVFAAEAVLHTLPASSLINYGRGLGAYYEIRHSVEATGAACVSVVGSSRGRESLSMPLLSELINNGDSKKYSVGNYSCPGGRADDIYLITKQLLESSSSPSLIIYFVSPRVLLEGPSSARRADVFGVFPNEYGKQSSTWLASLSEKPMWKVRNYLGEHVLLFRHRYFFRNLVPSLVRQRESTQPIRGGYSGWQKYTPNRSLVNRPVSDQQIKTYVKRLVNDRGEYILSESRINSLVETLKMARIHGARMIFVAAPISPDLQRYYPAGLYDRFLKSMETIQTDWGAQFYSVEDFGLKISRENFREESHLNLSGAEKLTRVLAEDIILPYLESTHAPVE